MKAEVPRNEEERLRALRMYRVLDTASEKTLDDLVQLAAHICETPIALVSLVDKDRQWFKTRVGLDATETPRDFAFCAHAILGSEVLVVPDALKDARFSDNPLVTGGPKIRFYAGAPLEVRDGVRLGTLCVLDYQSRQITPRQLEALKTLRQAVVVQLEMRRALADLKDVDKFLPMCAWCRSVRTPEGDWRPLHIHVAESVEVTHGVCPACERGLI